MPRAPLLLLLLTAPAFAGSRSVAADEQALKTFRLTLDNIRKATAVNRRLAVEAAKDPSIAKAAEKDSKDMESLDELAKELERDRASPPPSAPSA